MDSLLPVATWLRLARRDDGFVATTDSMRHFFTENSGVVSYAEALTDLWHQHCDVRRATKDENVAALVLVLAHVGHLERELASRLLLCDREDISDDMAVLACAVDRWCACGVLPPSSSALWTQLLRVTVVTLASCVRGSLEKERLEGFLSHLKARGEEVLLSYGLDDQPEKAMNWNEFIALDFSLETSALSRTKDGRQSIQQLRIVNAQQQASLSASPYPDEVQGSAGEACTSDPLWLAAAIFVKCCPPKSEPLEGVKIEDDGPYCEVFYDESSLVRGLQDGSDISCFQSKFTTREELAARNVPPVEAIRELQPTKREFIETEMSDLEAIQDVSVLRVRVASLLGQQLRRNSSLPCTKSSQWWEQVIRKTVNSLTSADSKEDATLQLIRLAAMHPEALMEILMSSAVATTQHHDVFVRLLQECPLLLYCKGMSKSEKPDAQKSSIAIAALCEAVYRDACQRDTTVLIEKAPAVRFLLHLAMPPRRPSASSDAASRSVVLTPDAVLQLIFWSILELCADSANPSPASRVFSLMRYFLEQVRTTGIISVSSSTLRNTIETVASVYSAVMSDTAEHEELEDSMLLVTDALLRARSSASMRPLTSTLVSCRDIRMQSLLVSHGIMASPIRGYVSGDLDPYVGQSPISDELRRSIDQQLWGLVWACSRDENGTSTDGYRSFLQKIGEQEYIQGNVTVPGHHLIQNRVSEILRSSGSGVFDRVVRTIDRFILPGAEFSHPTNSQELMEYALRCWSVCVFSSRSGGSLSTIRMLVKIVGLIDQAIGYAEENPPLLIRCLEATGLLYSWLQSHPPNPTMASAIDRIEVVVMRVLFQLRRLQQSDLPLTVEEKTIRSSVSSLLVSTRLIESESIVSFLRSSTHSLAP